MATTMGTPAIKPATITKATKADPIPRMIIPIIDA
jgi:hypothetical protein